LSRCGTVKKPKGERYSTAICAFDIEVYSDPQQRRGFMYVWQFAIEDYVVIGRTWNDYIEFQSILQESDTCICVYVHNLAYEFQFLAGVFEFSEVFSAKPRKPIRARCGHLEYRCSYLLLNSSLEYATNTYDVEHKKLPGEDFDYHKRRDQYTVLTPQELQYCINDVLGVVEIIRKLLARDDDTLATIPMTSTGYVRRDAKHAVRGRRAYLSRLTPDKELFIALREAFRGGNTHANRYLAGSIVKNVKAADRSSSYPDVLCNEKFPCSPFKKQDVKTYNRFLDGGAAMLMRLRIYDIKCGYSVTVPYMSSSKCRRVYLEQLDNGRILSAAFLEITVTDIDFRIIADQYRWNKMEVLDLWVTSYDTLPRELVELNVKYYRNKTGLKNVKGQELSYMKSKNLLNSIYGMMAQNPARGDITFINGEWREDDVDVAKCLEDYKRKGFVPYTWGVWCTAWARNSLQWSINAAAEGFVYADTDGIHYVGDIDFTAYNEDRKRRSIESGAWADDPKGIRHYMGVYEEEATADEFITLGAKRYAYTIGDKLFLTAAGVNKEKGAKELQKKGGLSVFADGFTFKEAGKVSMIYHDDRPRGIYAQDSEYRIGLSADYRALLDAIHNTTFMEEKNNENY